MNIGAASTLLLATGVFAYGLILTSGIGELRLFYDFPSLFIVVGGVTAAASMSFQYKKMFLMLKVGLLRFLKGTKTDYQGTISEVIKSIEAFRNGEGLQAISQRVNDNFFKECLTMLDNGVIAPEEAYKLMEDRNDNLFYQYNEDAGKLKVLGKYPPAFGMMGTTMGMIVLLANLNGADAIKRVGPAMGICLITTLYGTVLANFLFLPLADNLVIGAKEIYLKNRIVVEGVKCLMTKTNPIIAAEKLNSFLIPSERLDWKQLVARG